MGEHHRRYPEGTRLFGKVTNIADYGAFVEIEDRAWKAWCTSPRWTGPTRTLTRARSSPIGDEVEVVVLDIDEERRRISLGMKQCQATVGRLSQKFNKGDHVSASSSRSPTSASSSAWTAASTVWCTCPDISWDDTGEAMIRNYRKGQELETVVLAVDPERERISLGYQAAGQGPDVGFLALNEKGAIVTGTVQEVDAKGAVIALADGVEGYLRASELSRDRVEDARSVLKEGDDRRGQFMGVDRKNRTISLSVKAKDMEERRRRSRPTQR